METISHETTQSISVFSPDADGSWPVVLAYHGNEGSREDMALLGERIAATARSCSPPTTAAATSPRAG